MKKNNLQLKLFCLLVFVLLAMPRARIVLAGAPLYFIDILFAWILVLPMKGGLFNWVPKQNFTRLVFFYMWFVLLSELHGMAAYGTILESIYMMARFSLAASMVFIMPKLIVSPAQMSIILKSVVAGSLASALIVILYSIGATRGLVISLIFKQGFLNPGWEPLVLFSELYGAGGVVLRGRSLVGAATFTAGFLATTWPLLFIARDYFVKYPFWKNLTKISILLVPIGILMTYGRSAWLMVITMTLVLLMLGVGGNIRRVFYFISVIMLVLVIQSNLDNKLFYIDRVFDSAQSVIENPLGTVAARERLLSFTEPFELLMENPEWAFIGVGRTGNRVASRGGIEAQLYDESGLATHSGFAIGFYSFGLISAVIQVILMVSAFVFIFSRIRSETKTNSRQKLVWQSLLISWCGMTIWWLSGHGMIGEPRGVMLFFFLFGLIITFEKLRQIELFQQLSKE